MTRVRTIGLAAAAALACAGGTGDSAVETALKIAAVEARLPSFWSPTADGMADIPYTYAAQMTRRIERRGGKEVKQAEGASSLANWRQVRLERIPLEWGSFLKCVSVDGRTPCPEEWNQELERQTKAVGAMTAEDRATIDVRREERRERRRAFWAEFPGAMRFEAAGERELRFSPAPGWNAKKGPKDGMLTGVSGRLRFDAATYEVTSLEYDLARDITEPLMKLPKGAHFEIELARVADGRYAPSKIAVRRQVAGKAPETEVRVTEYSDYRKFDAQSKISFEDKGPDK